MPTKVKEVQAPIKSGSISDIVLHFLYIYNKTYVYGTPTSAELYEINSTRYKKKDNLETALSRLVDMKLITFYTTSEGKHYFITKKGIDCVYKLAMFRRRKNQKNKSKAGNASADFRWEKD